MRGRSLLARRPRLGGAVLALAVLGATIFSSAPGVTMPAAEPCTDKPAVFPVDDLRPGMVGTGLTVIKGREPDSFRVEILGVLDDGIAPGVDFILVQVSGAVIEKTGGIAAGFSGSPVYIDRKLVGAIAYGFFAADQTVGGVTPAEPMVDLFEYPGFARAAAPARVAAEPQPASEIRLGATLRKRAARATGANAHEFSTAEQLPVPVGVSGLNDRAMKRLGRLIDRAELPFVPYRASAFRGSDVAEERLQPGDSFGASISVGDLTFAGIGTTTAVCGDLAVAFGHPFFWNGRTLMGMNAADVLTVVRDPSHIFGPFKIANIAEFLGTVDNDRLAGIRGVKGILPPMVPITSDVRNPDLGKSRHGETRAITQEEGEFFFSFLPFLAAFHLLLNEDVVFDRIGDGTVSLKFTLEGTGPDGEAFRLKRDNMHFSEWDASIVSIFELLLYIAIIEENPFGHAEFTAIGADSTITQEHLVAKIDRVLSASSVEPRLKERRALLVEAGGSVSLRVFLLPEGSTTAEIVDLSLRVPKRPRGEGRLEVRGGGARGCLFCFFFEDEGEDEGSSKAKSFGDLLDKLRSRERNNDLVTNLRFRDDHKRRRRQDLVIRGRERIGLIVVK